MNRNLVRLVFILITMEPLMKNDMFAQTPEIPIRINESIGDTMNLQEREHFGMFSDIDGFQFAIFFLKPDSSVYAKVRFKKYTEEIVRTKIIELGSFHSLQGRIQKETDLSGEKSFSKKSIYIALGGGIPNGIRSELGFTTRNVGFGLTFNIQDSWSSDPGEGMIGFLLKLNFQSIHRNIIPYLLLNHASTIRFSFGETKEDIDDTFTWVSIGFIKALQPYLLIRPEIGIAYTSKSRSRINSSPLKKTLFGFNIIFECDFREIF